MLRYAWVVAALVGCGDTDAPNGPVGSTMELDGEWQLTVLETDTVQFMFGVDDSSVMVVSSGDASFDVSNSGAVPEMWSFSGSFAEAAFGFEADWTVDIDGAEHAWPTNCLRFDTTLTCTGDVAGPTVMGQLEAGFLACGPGGC